MYVKFGRYTPVSRNLPPSTYCPKIFIMDKNYHLKNTSWLTYAVEGGSPLDSQGEYVQYSEYEKYDRK